MIVLQLRFGQQMAAERLYWSLPQHECGRTQSITAHKVKCGSLQHSSHKLQDFKSRIKIMLVLLYSHTIKYHDLIGNY